MAEDTTTATDATNTGVEETLPVADATSNAAETQTVTEPSESSTEAQTVETVSPSEPDEKLRNYAANQGLELDSPSAIKAAQIAMKAQSEATRNYQRASELEKSTTAISDEHAETVAEATGQDPELLKRVQRVETRENVRDFWNQEGIDRSFEPAMIEVLKDKPYLAGDLDALYATAMVKTGGIAAVRSQGKREALTDLAHKQQAAVPTGNATTMASPKKKDFKDLSIAEMEKSLGFVKR